MRPFRRNILLTVLLLLALFCMTGPVYAAQSTLHVNVDGKTASFEALTTGNLVFLPARDLANLFDADLTYDAKEKELTLKTSKTKAILTIGSSSIVVNGKKVALDASPMIVENTTYVPVKAASAIWGASYGWNEQTLYIHTDGSAVQVPAIEKVFTRKQSVTIDGKQTPVSYVLIPQASDLKADVILAQNEIGETESLSSLAKRSSAKAAINGSYFQSYDSSKSQDPYGLLIKNGKLIHSEHTGSTIAFTTSGGIKMDIVRSAITATIGSNSYTVSLMNHTPSASGNSVVLYTTAYGTNTNCAFGTSVVVQNGTISAISSKKAVDIPSNGYVLLFTGDKAAAAQQLAKGTKVSYTVSYVNSAGQKVDWSNVRTAIGAGPLLLKDGNNVVNPEKEGFTDSAGFTMTVARSAVGVTKDGDILLVGGVKCTLNQLASVMSQLGAVQAICMDSGSSSGLYVPDASLPAPSKEISNALIFK
ncbi:MAG: phosphodiester glycosidase family protein [Peptococcaceae bacterium]